MPKTIKASFEDAVRHLVEAPRRDSSKAGPIKTLLLESLNTGASAALITEDKQLGNRITEQFSHKDPVVIFVLEPGVNQASLIEKINQRRYAGLDAVVVIGNRGSKGLSYEKLFINKPTHFSRWCEKDLGMKAELFAGADFQLSIVNEPRQLITYGAPGVGKSYAVDGLCDCQDVVKCFRTTFHPDSDYSTFVGAYKPTMAGEKIAYEFRPQAFMDAYVEAWKAMVHPDDGKVKNVVLVIEEINRGNCAQIFGDLFQLLDRGNGGYSTYPIDADSDIAIWLAKQFGNTLDGLAKPDEIRRQDDWTDVLTCKKLALPPNLYIWATMNTSDQSLFPVDSAFKRRWDWEYVPIAKPDKSGDANWKERKIEVGDALFDWWDFLSAINGHIAKATESEDKQLGYFFVKADDATGYISAKQFANKVLFYLFGDVFKSYELPKKDCFQLANNTVLAFRDFFYNEKVKEGDGASQVTREPGDVKLETVAAFLRNLKWDGKGVNEGTKDQTDGSQGEH